MASEKPQPLNQWRPTWGTYLITVLLVSVYMAERHAMAWGIMNSFLDDYAFQWTGFLSDPFSNAPKLISYIFLHADTSHLVGNLTFFLLVAPAVERVIGFISFGLLFVTAGIVSALTNGYFEPFTSYVIGASGAISGVMGAYFVLFPLHTPWPSSRWGGQFLRAIPAFFWIGLWLLVQIKSGFHLLMPEAMGGEVESVAYWAHAGGFVFGGLAMLPAIIKR